PLPTTLVIGRDGRVAARYLGALTSNELAKAVGPLIGPLSVIGDR
ncbi:MAG: hypothetical protein RIS76_603, partial [Verrucomicrobiota bacterium]